MKELTKDGIVSSEETVFSKLESDGGTQIPEDRATRILRTATAVPPKELLYPQLQINCKERAERQLLLIQVVYL